MSRKKLLTVVAELELEDVLPELGVVLVAETRILLLYSVEGMGLDSPPSG